MGVLQRRRGPLGSDAILYPTLSWQLAADRAGKLDAELTYVTGGMRWGRRLQPGRAREGRPGRHRGLGDARQPERQDRIYTGDAFDIVGERKRTDYALANNQSQLEEAFEIRIRNRKKEPVQVRVAERLYRWVNWEIVQESDEFEKTEAQSIEFRGSVGPDQEKVVTYRVRYNWR